MSQVLCRIVIIVLAVTIPSGPSSPALGEPAPENKSENDAVRDLDAMIDALSNRVNTAPQILGKVAEFSEEYDRDEQLRVWKVLRELKQRNGNALWPRLVAHYGDTRYAFTHFNGNGRTNNTTVGEICKLIGLDAPLHAYLCHSPLSKPNINGKRRRLVRGPFGRRNPSVDWYEKRKTKQLYELQIELCEWSITDPEALEELSSEQRDEFVKKVKEQIETLQETHEAVVNREGGIGFGIEILDSRYVRQIREPTPEGGSLPAGDDEK